MANNDLKAILDRLEELRKSGVTRLTVGDIVIEFGDRATVTVQDRYVPIPDMFPPGDNFPVYQYPDEENINLTGPVETVTVKGEMIDNNSPATDDDVREQVDLDLAHLGYK